MSTVVASTVVDRLERLAREDAAFVSLHTAPPGPSGLHEVESPRYMRQSVEWDLNGRNHNSLTFTLSDPEQPDRRIRVTHIGFWDTAYGGGIFQFAGSTEPEDTLDDYYIPQQTLLLEVEA